MNSRVPTAVVAGGIFLSVLFFGGEGLFALLVAAAAVIGVYEAVRMGPAAPPAVEARCAAVWGGVIALGFLNPVSAVPGALLALGTGAYFSAWMLGAGPSSETTERWGRVAGAWLWVAVCLGHAIWIRRHGPVAVLFPLLVVWAGDTAAYYVGSRFGRRKLAPAVSPNKTVEGAGASLLASVVTGMVASVAAQFPQTILTGALLGFGLNLLAQLGDLIESLLKRCAGCKDSGSIFPGHGGLLDRVDALLLVLPVYAAYLSWAME